MDVLGITFRRLQILLFCLTLSGCQLGYILNSGWQQAKLYNQRAPIQRVIADPKTSPNTANKLSLVLAANEFAEKKLFLKQSNNYKKFVALDRPYVSYIVHAAPVFALKSYEWWFPITGKVPYKGYFNLESAQKEAASFPKEKYDTYVRGVTAYSTLGWFDDPVWSSMLSYSNHDLVNTIIHETVHVTIFIKSNAEFNERLATFLGDWGTELFYLEKEGKDSATLKLINLEKDDQKQFSQFISKEMQDLRKWYATFQPDKMDGQKLATLLNEKEQRLKAILLRFTSELKPRLRTNSYQQFSEQPLNNARLLGIGTYLEDLSDFEKLRKKLGNDYKQVLEYCKSLADKKDPLKTLQEFISQSTS